MNVNAAILRAIASTITGLGLTHVFACLWFLTAKFDNFGPESWITRKGL
jgi:hypothetical protein